MKKVWIASIFATLMLLVPMTSVVGVSDVENDCGCQVISSRNLVRLERLLNRLESYSKIILLLPKFYPEIAENCKELSNRITSLAEMNEELKPDIPLDDNTIICGILLWLIIQAAIRDAVFCNLLEKYKENPILYNIIYTLFIANVSLFLKLLDLFYDTFDCWEDPFPPPS